MNEYDRKREINRKAKKKYYEKNKEEINKKSIEWAKNNPKKIKESQQRFYEKNLDEQRQRVKKYREHNIETVLRKERDKNQTDEQKEKNRLKIKSYRERNKSKVKLYKEQFAKDFPEIVNAHRLVRNAIRRKEIFRPSQCSKCLKECKAEAHHEDYMKPLDIIWLCRSCHGKEHRKHKDDHVGGNTS